MKIVIDIDKEWYSNIIASKDYIDEDSEAYLILNGTPYEEKRPHGEWIRNDNGTYSCSICQSWIPKEQHYYARYCLHCGRVMKEGEAE